MSKKVKVLITFKEKMAIFIVIFSKFSKFAISIQFMNTLFKPNITPNLPIVIIYWIYSNWVTNQYESDYINAMERLIYQRVVSRIDIDDYNEYVRSHSEYFKLPDEE